MSSETVKFAGYAAYESKGELKPFEYVPVPLRDEDVQIKISHCGVCHSDVHSIDNDWGFSQFPCVPGHEIVGIVEAVGPRVTKHKVGDRVGVGAQRDCCHKCPDCAEGDETMCARNIYTYGAIDLDGNPTYGGYASNIRVNQDFVIPIPESIDSASAAPLLCAGITVFAPLKRFRRAGDKVGVIGIGGLGHLAIQFAKALGHEVTAISTTKDKEEEARKFGATNFLCIKDEAAVKAAFRTFDLMICSVPSSLPMDQYLSLLRKDGRICLLGAPTEPVSFQVFGILMTRASVCGSLVGNPSELIEMMQLAAEKNVRPQIETMPLCEVNTAVNRVRSGPYPRYRFVLTM